MNILFVCRINKHRSKTAEEYFRKAIPENQYKSAGVSKKQCEQGGTTLLTVGMLDWADKVFVMEELHYNRIKENTSEKYLNKIQVLNIEDKYQFMHPELIALLKERVVFV